MEYEKIYFVSLNGMNYLNKKDIKKITLIQIKEYFEKND